MGGFFDCGGVEMAVESFGVLGFGFGSGFGMRGFALEGEGLLGGVEVVEFGLGFVAEEAGELSQGYGFFGCVDDCFDLCFKAHGLVGVLLSIPMVGMILWPGKGEAGMLTRRDWMRQVAGVAAVCCDTARDARRRLCRGLCG